MRILIAAVLIATACFTAYGEVTTGSAAPDFTLKDTHGHPHTLTDLKGRIVILEWINHGCPFVVKHYSGGNMQSLQKKYGSQDNVVWFSICSSAPGKQGHYTADEWNEITEEKGASPTAVLIDESGEVGKKYGARTTPHMFVVGRDGTVVYQGAIDSIKSTDKDDVADAENYVAAALDAVLAGKPVENATTVPYGCSVKYAN